jgi:hypothetical protein
MPPNQGHGDQGTIPMPPTIAPTEGVPEPAPPSNLPPGVHPYDPSVPYSGGELRDSQEVPSDTAGYRYPTGRKPWDTDNEDALAIWERASHDWTGDTVTIGMPNPTLQLIGRQPGRKCITLWCPSTGTAVCIAPTQGVCDQQFTSGIGGLILNPGDSVTINTEAQVWAGILNGNTTGTVAFLAEYNPPGGGLGTT